LDVAFIPQAAADEQVIAEFESTAHRPGGHVWFARRLLRPFLSDFALNGIFGTFPLFLLRTEHWRELLGDRAGGRLLDVGAAAGDVTATLAPLFDEVVTTDTARPMVRRLRRRGWESHCLDLADGPGPWATPFDTVALLNVLDRTVDGPALLTQAVHACRPGGTVIVAMALPYSPWHYVGGIPVRPRRRLSLEGETFADDLRRLLDFVLPAAGLDPLCWVRTPYVSAGQEGHDLHRLDCAVVVSRRR
jgi:SAM-dependent methyltransferase